MSSTPGVAKHAWSSLRTYIEHPQDLDVAALQIRCPLGTQSQELLSTAMHV
jgi:hypothetical protein